MIDKNEHEHADGTIHSHRQGAYQHIHKVGEPVPENTSTPSPVAPEPKWEDTVLTELQQFNAIRSHRLDEQIVQDYPLSVLVLLEAQAKQTATAYKAHYDPIVEGLKQKLEDVSSMAARLVEENTELQNKIIALETENARMKHDNETLIELRATATESAIMWKQHAQDLESQLAHSQPLIEQKVRREIGEWLEDNRQAISGKLRELIARLKAGEPLEGGKG